MRGHERHPAKGTTTNLLPDTDDRAPPPEFARPGESPDWKALFSVSKELSLLRLRTAAANPCPRAPNLSHTPGAVDRMANDLDTQYGKSIMPTVAQSDCGSVVEQAQALLFLRQLSEYAMKRVVIRDEGLLSV